MYIYLVMLQLVHQVPWKPDWSFLHNFAYRQKDATDDTTPPQQGVVLKILMKSCIEKKQDSCVYMNWAVSHCSISLFNCNFNYTQNYSVYDSKTMIESEPCMYSDPLHSSCFYKNMDFHQNSWLGHPSLLLASGLV